MGRLTNGIAGLRTGDCMQPIQGRGWPAGCVWHCRLPKGHDGDHANAYEREIGCVSLSVCVNGHAEPISEPRLSLQIRCGYCDEWTWKDGNYCAWCGKKDPGGEVTT